MSKVNHVPVSLRACLCCMLLPPFEMTQQATSSSSRLSLSPLIHEFAAWRAEQNKNQVIPLLSKPQG